LEQVLFDGARSRGDRRVETRLVRWVHIECFSLKWIAIRVGVTILIALVITTLVIIVIITITLIALVIVILPAVIIISALAIVVVN
jgi:hypothetical protein